MDQSGGVEHFGKVVGEGFYVFICRRRRGYNTLPPAQRKITNIAEH